MNARVEASVIGAPAVDLNDKYTKDSGRVYISGTQALARLPMLQRDLDRAAGLNTAGYVSGYRGSPLGGLDMALWKAKGHLAAHDVVFQPGLNEDLAATAVWGTQQLNLFPGATRDGIFSMWYGKGPGVDRSIDVLKHANAAGTAPLGGVLLLAGDDHAAKSSSVAHQSEHVLIASGIPVLYPATVQEYLDFGLHGWAMSRHTGLWVSMKCVTDIVESSASVDLEPDRFRPLLPTDDIPPGGLGIRWPDTPLEQEARLLNYKWYAAQAYARLNGLNRIVLDSPRPRLGIMTAGKAYLDVRQALADLGLDEQACGRIGIRLMKVGCVWPLDAQDTRNFATGLEEILVVEEKRQILEYAIKEELYNWRDDVRPRIVGKFEERGGSGEWATPRGAWLIPANYELSPAVVARVIARRLANFDLPAELRARIDARLAVIDAKEREARQPTLVEERKPWFCSGCPHNTSTRVPEGSRAVAGIGCHYMAMWMNRSTDTFSQMGGEGVAWLGQKDFTSERHIFANLGDGTYFHSGLLAIRASIAANAPITYKILYNDAVAMTGGQPVDGTLTVPRIARQMLAEGVAKVVVVSDEPEKYIGALALPASIPIHHRKELDAVQRELREWPGTSVLIYDQTCATEKRRRRKRGDYPDPPRRAFINTAVCEGCGDCSVQSNCLSVEPSETEFGTKRRINQSSCNKDFSCVDGFCPSFVIAEGATLRKHRPQHSEPGDVSVPSPDIPPVAPGDAFRIVVAGVGGTGVVTVGALLGMAAHIERKGVCVLDMAGLAQKGGAVLSHVQISNRTEDIHATRVPSGQADLVIGCDALVASSKEVLTRLHPLRARAVINDAPTPTASFLSQPNWKFPGKQAADTLAAATAGRSDVIDAAALAVEFLGDAIYANPLLLGFAWQKSCIPLKHESLIQAIRLNGVSVEKNIQAFELGRQVAAFGESRFQRQGRPKAEPGTESLDEVMERLQRHITSFQDARYARVFRDSVESIRAKEAVACPDNAFEITRSVAHNLAKLMTYKDEYEVARLHTSKQFLQGLRDQFEGEPGKDYRLTYLLAPPALAKATPAGHPAKRKFGPWVHWAFLLLAPMKRLRGTPLDGFGYTTERKMERKLVADYLALVTEFSTSLTQENRNTALTLAQLPQAIRGYGHVKHASVIAARQQWDALLETYRQDLPQRKAA